MEKKFSADQLVTIVEQSMLTQCACPSLVSRLVSDLQYLHDYQRQCLRRDEVDVEVHRAILDATERAYPILENCLVQILALENWNLETLEMPEQLRGQQIRQMEATCVLPAYQPIQARA